MDMEVPSYKLNASLRGVPHSGARKVCPECSVQRPISEAEGRFTGLPIGTSVRFASALTAEDKQKRKDEGTLCTRCGGTGYQGRIGTYELMKVNRAIREAIKQETPTD